MIDGDNNSIVTAEYDRTSLWPQVMEGSLMCDCLFFINSIHPNCLVCSLLAFAIPSNIELQIYYENDD